MIKIIASKKRHFSDFGWLKTYWLFSFAEYYDPENIQFGALRVFNDDIVEPGTGFPTHPHREMEIVTLVLNGEITHEDSMGNKNVIKENDVQRMSAGTGLTHSEFNLAKKPVHFYQIWIFPDQKGLAPSYEQKNFSPASWKNALFPVASGQGVAPAVSFHTDATIYRSFLEERKSVGFSAGESRRLFLYVTSGKVDVNGTPLTAHDQARIDLEKDISIKGLSDSEFILIDVPSCKGWGYGPETLKGKKR
jgi:quercetin 2,3-dioxygenase